MRAMSIARLCYQLNLMAAVLALCLNPDTAIAQRAQDVRKVVLDTDLGFASDDAMALISSKRKKADPYARHIQRQIRRFENSWNR